MPRRIKNKHLYEAYLTDWQQVIMLTVSRALKQGRLPRVEMAKLAPTGVRAGDAYLEAYREAMVLNFEGDRRLKAKYW
jgi:hypothetical protein